MRTKRILPAAFALSAGLLSAVAAAQPAQAGVTGRTLGCAAHWEVTAAWNECINSPGATLRLQVACDWEPDYSGPWKNITGSVDPVDDTECHFKAATAWNGYS